MFGYIRPFKPQLRFCEYDVYQGVYCGLCKELGREYGQTLRFTLSYDFAFLGILGLSLEGGRLELLKEPCAAHPWKKTPCISCKGGGAPSVNYAASAAILSLWHKLSDDKKDMVKGVKGRLLKSGLGIAALVWGRAYKKAASSNPELAEVMERAMKEQWSVEGMASDSLDAAAEPTAMITGKLAEGLSSEPKTKRILYRIGQMLGRYIYITDALDDISKDEASGSYNPLLLIEGVRKPEGGFDRELAREKALSFFRFTMGELASAYVLLPVKKYKSILDNVIYQGLEHTFALVYQGKELPDERSI